MGFAECSVVMVSKVGVLMPWLGDRSLCRCVDDILTLSEVDVSGNLLKRHATSRL